MGCRKTIQGKIIWIDNNDAWSTRPSSTQINLLRNGEISQSEIIPSDGDGSYSFDCLPINDKMGNEYIYSISEPETPTGYRGTIDKYNIINTLNTLELKYVFNNIVHNDYTGKVYNIEAFTYPTDSTITIKKKEDIFSEYTGDCEFIGWNTLANGNGTYYYPESSLVLSENTILYAIWRSCMPTINDVFANNTTIRGTGVVLKGNITSRIQVRTPSTVITYTIANGTWSTAVPIDSRPLITGTQITATQTEQGKQPSYTVSTIVKP